MAWASIDDIKARLATIKGQITVGDDETYTFTTDDVTNAINIAHQMLLAEYGITADVEDGIDTTKTIGAILKELEILIVCANLLERLPQDDITNEGLNVFKSRIDQIQFKLNKMLDLNIWTESLTDPEYSVFYVDNKVIYNE